MTINTRSSLPIQMLKSIFVLTVILLGLILHPAVLNAQASLVTEYALNASSLADDAARYAKKAYYAETLDDAYSYVQKTKSYAEEAEEEANNAEAAALEVDCNDAASYASSSASYASDAARYARKALDAENLEDAQYYARKAQRAAEDAESEAISCSEVECEEELP